MDDNDHHHSHLLWKEISRKKLLGCRIFDVYMAERESPSGTRGEFVFLDSPDWVNIVPLLQNEKGEDCFLMVRQFRQGSESITMEFPGGVLDPGEEPHIGAERELLEETGYVPRKLTYVGKINPNPALMNNWSYTYVGEDLVCIEEQDLDEDEYVDIEQVPVAEVEAHMGEEPYINAIIMVALAWYQKWKNNV
jgi:8-oxo-dGTP pyrophosphatase MutT (NUDIX family)